METVNDAAKAPLENWRVGGFSERRYPEPASLVGRIEQAAGAVSGLRKYGAAHGAGILPLNHLHQHLIS